MRMIKTETEFSYMKKALEVSEEAIINSLPLITEGKTILELHRYYTKAFTEEEGCEVDHILISASPVPTGEVFSPFRKKFDKGQVIKIDVGAKYNNYGADFSRQWAFGPIPEKDRTIFETILEAVNAMVKLLKPGTKISDLYHAGVNIMKKIDPDYPRRLFMGHSTGLQTHERPYITPYTEDLLQPGMLMCVEVPYYQAGGIAFNVEDEYLITETGHQFLSNKVPEAMTTV